MGAFPKGGVSRQAGWGFKDVAVLDKDFLDISKLIRSIQRAEGNPDCFHNFKGHCDQLDCAWRAYCLEESEQGLKDITEPDDQCEGLPRNRLSPKKSAEEQGGT